MKWYIDVLKKYAVFTGRARRTEFWMYVLFTVIVLAILGVIDGMLGSNGVLAGIYALATIIPSIAVAIRRLHDTNRSGWWIFIQFVPVIGSIWYLVLLVLDSTPGENQFGPNPKGV